MMVSTLFGGLPADTADARLYETTGREFASAVSGVI
jgi:hypothetical protein